MGSLDGKSTLVTDGPCGPSGAAGPCSPVDSSDPEHAASAIAARTSSESSANRRPIYVLIRFLTMSRNPS